MVLARLRSERVEMEQRLAMNETSVLLAASPSARRVDHLQTSLESMAEKYERLEKQRQALQSALDQCQSEKSSLELKVDSVTRAKNVLESRLGEAEERLQMSTSEISRLRYVHFCLREANVGLEGWMRLQRSGI